jgi:hypothetical protein
VAKSDSTRNADGTTYSVRAVSGLMGTELRVSHSTIKTAGGTLLWDGPHYGTRLYYLPGGSGGQMVPITHSEYAHASTPAEARRLALAFFVESYAATLRHAEEEGIPVRDCFA